ncbi:MAG: DMT family transporter [Anaerolineae bacterium]|nr:DMT family transporter [Anaerolineae bacterium]
MPSTGSTSPSPAAGGADQPARFPPVAGSGVTWYDVALVVTMFLWATHYSVAKAAIDILPPFVYNGMRFVLGALALGVYLKATGHRLAMPRTEWRAIILVGFLSFVCYQAFFMNGLRHTVVSHSVLISTTAPALLVMYNVLRGHDRGTRRLYAGVLLALGGVLLVIVSRYAGQFDFGSDTLLGDVLSVIAAFVWVYATLKTRKPLENNPAQVTNFWIVLWGAFFAMIIAVPDALAYDWSTFSWAAVGAIVYASIFAVAISGTLWSVGLQKLGASRAAVYLNIQPVAAALIAILFLGEPLTIWLVIGTALALLGMWLVRLG